MRPRVRCCGAWPLCLDRDAYREAVEAANDAGALTQLEASALIAGAVRIYSASDDIVRSFRRALVGLAAATTLRRAQSLARWTPFDPKALMRAIISRDEARP